MGTWHLSQQTLCYTSLAEYTLKVGIPLNYYPLAVSHYPSFFAPCPHVHVHNLAQQSVRCCVTSC
jgi:hypothetical protein